ncbi:CHAT domain-containing protein [Aspergillus carlsbadensis]|nr:CHAT domain-containing protein [Aspergillus carlsbadensis]
MDRSPLTAQLGYEGRALLQAYRQTGEKDYLNESISLARQALENALPLERAIYLNDLGSRLRERFGACRNPNDISEAIELVERSSQTISDCSLRAIVLNNLGTFLSDQFEWSQDPGDLERGIRAANHALDLSSADVSFQAQCKNTLCLLYGYCYTKSGNLEDLETATRMAHEAVEMTNENDESLAMFMGNLGICYERRFKRLGYSADIDKAIYYARRTVDFITSSDDATEDTDNPTERSLYLKNLSNALGQRFAVSDCLQDIEDAIEYGIDAANLIAGFPQWTDILHNISLLLEDRFMRLGDITDLDEAIELENKAASAISAEDPRSLTHWDQLGLLYAHKFDFGDEMDDLDRSIEFAQRAVDASSSNDLDTARFKWHMALALNRRFECLDGVADLDHAILLGTEALKSIAQNDPRRIDLLLDISDFQHSKYLKSGSMEHFESVATLIHEAMMTDVLHGFDRPLQLCTISRRFIERYTFTKNEDDIQRSIQFAQKAVGLVPAGHPRAPCCLLHSSLALETRYLAQGSVSDLEEAIRISHDALAATSLNRLDRVEILYSLSMQLTHRYEQLGALVDLEEAIHLMREIKENMPRNIAYGRVVCLKTLSDQLGYLFARDNDMSTLTEAIDVANEALGLYTDEDIAKASILNSLGLLVKLRFEVTGLQEDLEAAIDVQRKALQIVPRENPERSIALYNLSAILEALFRHSREPRHLVEATNIGWEAVNAAHESHPNRAMYLNSVGMLLQEYPYDIGDVLSKELTPADMFTEALRHENSPPLDRIKAGQNAFHSCIVDGEWSAANSVAKDVVKLFPLLVPRWMNRSDQQHLLKNISRFTSLAASAVLHVNGLPESALQILEAGRGVMAGLTIDLKTEISALEELEPALYHEYTQLRRQILLPTVSSLSKATGPGQSLFTRKGRRTSRSNPPRLITAGPERVKNLKILETLEDRIRSVPGFEHFLERHSEQDHISLAKSGPIVAFNVTEYRSDAIIITNIKITSIRLKNLHFRDVRAHIPKVIGESQLSKGRPSTQKQRNQELQNILQWLWDTAVLPVLTELNLYTRDGRSESALPRIWWMSSGYMGLFPMHAAGNGEGATAMDYVISSYIPTLQILKFSQTRHNQRLLDNSDPNVKMLVIPAPTKAGQQDLDIEAEIQSIKEGLKDIVSYTILDRPCREDVLKELPSSHILHFSCHGKSNATDPSDSALVLAQTATSEQYSLLTVKDLTEINHDKAQLAYLSACSTAENSSDNLLDEVIHMASTFQLIGFPHVVGTLWKIGDRAAVAVSRLFYDELGRRVATGEDLDKSIAYALHGALQKHRSSKRVARGNDVLSWAPFIYMGA